ncbi:26S proteasome non-ATPase regulatory subunit 8-like [Drosophila miranda]|uniref:26S proteasome non-ATPase regulatory subunit 8-like n=1 Tax=Drosophila miranda TaxID=7229 RepID=UPI00143F9A90|nr:26S proteasome non-ATPase regulatory subunit 8-like [Drosophila miranda]XP_033244470.1 26S proteasome non-ATPase regulatory subunit 8-like [Drosophila miranda]XP_033244471.1 26S proteasome non-ATPase regulatory subunit 8-like [Drosophila miranda]
MSNLYKDIKAEWSKRAPNLLRCGQLLGIFKLEILGGFLMPHEMSKSNPQQKDQLVRSRDVLEIAVEHSITVKDYAAFERYMAQLKMYYYDYDKFLEPSQEMHKMIGLSLLYMLATNRIADFHIALERLPSALLLQDRFIMPVLALENYFMEGRYNKILEAKKSLPSEIYGNFMDMLVLTAREEIASCIEKSYLKMTPKQAAQRLGLRAGGKELLELVERRHWTLDAQGNYDYAALNIKPKDEVPANDIATHNLSYATELEKII